MSAKIINAFGRTDQDLPEPEGPIIDTASVFLLEELTKWAKEGTLKFVGVIGVSNDAAASTLQFHGASLSDLGILNLAVDALKEQIANRARGDTHREYVSVSAAQDERSEDDGDESA